MHPTSLLRSVFGIVIKCGLLSIRPHGVGGFLPNLQRKPIAQEKRENTVHGQIPSQAVPW